MESKNWPHIADNANKNCIDLVKCQPKSETINTNKVSEQMPALNSTEPKQRVIKQIVSLDSKKLKALGIESNILSALTKFNGKEKRANKKKPTMPIKNAKPSTATSISTTTVCTAIEISEEKPSTSAAMSPVKNVIPSLNILTPNKVPDTSSSKKIQVLSNVLLCENKLDLKSFSPIAPPSPVKTKHISYMSPVSRPSQIKRNHLDNLSADQTSTPIAVQPENVTASINEKAFEPPELIKNSPESPAKLIKKSASKSSQNLLSHKLEKKSPDRSTVKSPHTFETDDQVSEIDALKGFSLPELKCSRDQFKYLQNEVRPKPSTNPNSLEIEHDDGIQDNISPNVEPDKKESLYESTDLSNSFATTDTISSDSDSESSDLDELIKEAKLTIAKERVTMDTDEADESFEPPVISKKLRIVEKKFVDMLTEQLDKDRVRMIDEFLDTTINSFRIEDDSPSDSDSDDERTDLHMDVDVDVDIDKEKNYSVPKEPSTNENDKMVLSNIGSNSTEEIEESEPQTDVVVKPLSELRKRKISIAKSEINTKRKKSISINEDGPLVQMQEAITNVDVSVDDTKMSPLKESLETVQGKWIFFLILKYLES